MAVTRPAVVSEAVEGVDGGPQVGATKVLVVDDESAVRESIGRALRFEGYTVDLAPDGVEGLDRVRQGRPDVVVLDVAMPRLDGLDMCRSLRSAGNPVPVLMLTARTQVRDRVGGLDAGADDYLVKPFALTELLARLRALTRRHLAGPNSLPLRFADVELDPQTREVRRAGADLRLTRTEFTLLELLMRHPRQVLTRGQILDVVWGFDSAAESNGLEVYIAHLRRKTEADGGSRLIHTERGVGYALRER